LTQPSQPTTAKPKRLYFKTYLQFIRNSIGTQMFRNFYIEAPDGTQLDALDDGSNSCAFYVSSVLALFKKLKNPHGTVASTLKDLEQSGWQTVPEADLKPGDVVLWEAQEFAGTWYEHIGFYTGDNRAVSTSWKEKKVREHDVHFDGQRAVKQVWRYTDWEHEA
jgi:hypothetical protein